MPSSYTPNYQLSQWSKGDQVRMEDFNADNAKLDAAIKAVDTKADAKADASALNALTQTVNAKASTAALNALTQTVNGKGNCRVVTGSYVGTGQCGESHPISLDFAATMGKAPVLLLVYHIGGGGLTMIRGNTSAAMPNTTSSSHVSHVTWTSTGVSWYNPEYPGDQANYIGVTYLYCAFFD